jgi:tetratricopeptide (TPR) repeat protein
MYCKNLKLLLLPILILFLCGVSSCTEYRAKRHYEKGLTALAAEKTSEAVIEFKNAVKLDPDHTDALYQLGVTYLKLGGQGNISNGYNAFSSVITKKPAHVSAHLKLGEILLLQKDTKEALKQSLFVIQKEPKNAEGRLLYARIKVRDRNLSEAKAEYQKAISLDPKQLPAYNEWATILVLERKFEEAETVLKKSVLANPKDQTGFFLLANFYRITGKIKDEEAQYQKAIQIAPKSKTGYFLLTRYYARQKNFSSAEKTLKTAVMINPEDAEPFLLLGDFYLGQNKKNDAEKAYLSAKSAQPKSGKGRKRLAMLYLSQFKKKEADVEIESLLKDNSSDPDAIFLKGRLSLLDHKNLPAIDLFKKVLNITPAYAEASYYLGLAYAGTKDMLQAKSAFLTAVQNAPRDIRSHFALATLYMQDGSYDLVIPEVQAVLKLDPNNVMANNLLADVAIIQKQVLQAETLSQKILTQSPKDMASLFRMGVIRRMQKKTGDALSFFEKILLKDVNNINTLSQIVAIHLENKKSDKAIGRVGQQIEVAPKNSQFYTLQGRLYSGAGQLESAEAVFKKGNRMDPAYLAHYLDLAVLYATQKKFVEGISELDKAIKINPNFAEAYMLKGTIYDSRGNQEAASTAYEKVLKLNPKHPSAANNLAWIYAEQGDKLDRALALASTAKENNPNNPMISDTLGWIYYKKELYFKAVSLLSESAEKVHGNPTIQYHLGMAYSKRGEPGDKQKAREFLQKAIKIDPKFPQSDIVKKTLESL